MERATRESMVKKLSRMPLASDIAIMMVLGGGCVLRTLYMEVLWQNLWMLAGLFTF